MAARNLFTPELISYAQRTQATYGVYASCCLAAAFVETTCGTNGSIFPHTNNYFNIKKGSWKGATYRGYRVYATRLESFLDFGRLLTTPAYARLTAGTTNVFSYIDAYAERYAPRSDGNYDYAGKMKRTITKYNLTQYDSAYGGAVSYTGDTITVTTLTGEDAEVHVWHAESPTTISQWGLLRYFESVDSPSYGADRASKLLQLYNHKQRQIKVTDAFGDATVRAGTLIPVKLDFGDMEANNYLMVEKVTHKFSNGGHTMDLTLEGWWSD